MKAKAKGGAHGGYGNERSDKAEAGSRGKEEEVVVVVVAKEETVWI